MAFGRHPPPHLESPAWAPAPSTAIGGGLAARRRILQDRLGRLDRRPPSPSRHPGSSHWGRGYDAARTVWGTSLRPSRLVAGLGDGTEDRICRRNLRRRIAGSGSRDLPRPPLGPPRRPSRHVRHPALWRLPRPASTSQETRAPAAPGSGHQNLPGSRRLAASRHRGGCRLFRGPSGDLLSRAGRGRSATIGARGASRPRAISREAVAAHVGRKSSLASDREGRLACKPATAGTTSPKDPGDLVRFRPSDRRSGAPPGPPGRIRAGSWSPRLGSRGPNAEPSSRAVEREAQHKVR